MRFLLLFIITFSLQSIFGQNTLLYKIKKGETLYKLSKIYSISIEEIQALNDIEKNEVKPGQDIKIEYTISENEIKNNTNIYHKELKEKSIADNEAYLKNKIADFEKQKTKLINGKDDLELMNLSKSKRKLQDSISKYNNIALAEITALSDKINLFESQNKLNDTIVIQNSDTATLEKKEEEEIDPIAARIAENARLRKENAAKLKELERLLQEAEEKERLEKLRKKEEKIAKAELEKEKKRKEKEAAKKTKEEELLKAQKLKDEKAFALAQKEIEDSTKAYVNDTILVQNTEEDTLREAKEEEIDPIAARIAENARLRKENAAKIKEQERLVQEAEEKERLEKL
ncbi:MAG: LysM peptidoglycan-binding domain-containing protein, partial [Chitinophagales bacterium]